MKRNKIYCESTFCQCSTARESRGLPKKYTFVYVNEKLKIIYYDIPKCSSSTIRSIFFNPSMSLANPQTDLKKYFKFTFCRNPFDRMVSNYSMWTQNDHRVKQIQQFHKNPRELSFPEFVKFTCQHTNHHWLPQYDFIHGYEIDHIGRLENIQQDFDIVCDKAGISRQKLPHKNKTKHKHYTEYYDNETLEIVSEKYAQDIEYFGYKFGE